MGVEKLKKYTNRISTVIFATVLIMFAVLMASSFSTDQASAQTAPSTNTQTDATTEVSSEGTTCAVERIGWIVCPVIEGAAKMSDYLFGFLAKYFLEIDAELLTSSPKGGGGTVTAWEQARNLANIMFVIAFILIIYSQITGSGLNNYGIKRMLPRLIVAAIAVNLSYYICQVMVDLSNLLGYNIMSALQQISNQIGPSVMGADAQGTDTQTGGGTLAQIATYALAAAGIVWVLIAFMGGTIGLVLVTCIVIVAVLLLRKAFIVLLVVVSPIAFVFYLLPNTEKYFSKWLSMFWKLLLVFPIVALLLGAGQLASTIILVSDAQRNGTPNQCGAPPATDAPQQAGEGGVKSSSYGVEGECALTIENNGKSQQAGITLSLVATGVAVAPLLAVWAVLQGALAAAGAIGGKISGAIQKGANSAGKGTNALGKAAQKRAGASAQAAWQRSQARGIDGTGRGLDSIAGRFARRGARRRTRYDLSKASLEHAQKHAMDHELAPTFDEYGNQLPSTSPILTGLGDATQQRAQRSAQASLSKIQAEEVQAASISAQDMNDDMLRNNLNGDVEDPKVAAAIQELAKRQDFKGLEEAINKFGSSGKASLATRTLSESIARDNPGFFTAGNLGAMARGDLEGKTYADIATTNIANGAFSPEKMAETGPSALAEASRLAATSTAAKAELASSAGKIAGDVKLRNKLGRNTTAVANIQAGRTFVPGADGSPDTWV